MSKKEETLNNRNKPAKPSQGKKKGLKPHHLKKQILLNNLYYTTNKEELEKTLQELNAELSKAGITLTADEYRYLNIDQDELTVLMTRKSWKKKSGCPLRTGHGICLDPYRQGSC